MLLPPLPGDEEQRLKRISALGHLYAPTTRAEDALVRLARNRFGVEFAVHSLITHDEQWYKASDGLDAVACSREQTFCAHALEEELLIVEDATRDPRFSDNPAVTGEPYIRFYAGYPLRIGHGSAVGTFCVFGTRPRKFSDDDRQALQRIGRMAQGLLQRQDPQLAEVTELFQFRDPADVREHLDEVTGAWGVSVMPAILNARLQAAAQTGEHVVLLMLQVDLPGANEGQQASPRMVQREFARTIRGVAPLHSPLFHNGAGSFIAACIFGKSVDTRYTPELLRANVLNSPGWEMLGIAPPRFLVRCSDQGGSLLEEAESFMQQDAGTGGA